jgi:hypothetical protein
MPPPSTPPIASPQENPISILATNTFTPGTHRAGSAINFAYGTVVILDGYNKPNSVFLFQAGSILVTAANTSIIMKGGGKAENVLWALGTATLPTALLKAPFWPEPPFIRSEVGIARLCLRPFCRDLRERGIC